MLIFQYFRDIFKHLLWARVLAVYINTSNQTFHNHIPNVYQLYHHAVFFISRHDITNDCAATTIAHNQPPPVSNLTTTTNVDTYSNNYDNTHSIENPKKHNHSTPEIPETNNTTTPVHTNVYSRLFQMSSSTSTTSLNPPFM